MGRVVGLAVALVVALGVLTGVAALTNKSTIDASAVVPPRAASAVTGQTSAKPTSTQTLVCSSDLKVIVKRVLKLKKLPQVHSAYAAGLYTCTYDLPMGPMVVSVQHSATKTAALTYLTTRSSAVHAGQKLAGLGEGAYATGTGVVLTIKDNETLEVDTTGLPLVFGSEQQKRSDLAYEIASDVLGCWTEDES